MAVPSSPGQAPPRKASHSIAFYFGTGLIVPVSCLLVLWGVVAGIVLSGTLDQARSEFPDSESVRVFRALTLLDAGRSDEAVAELMTVITTHPEVTDLGRYAQGLRGLAQWLADGRPE